MTMLILHILIALTSVAFTTYVFVSPSRHKLRISYALVASTLASGTLLLVQNPAHMIQACTMGLFYTGLVTLGILSAQRKLANEKTNR